MCLLRLPWELNLRRQIGYWSWRSEDDISNLFRRQFLTCRLPVADLIGEVVERVLSANAVSRHVELRRVCDVETADFERESVHSGQLNF